MKIKKRIISLVMGLMILVVAVVLTGCSTSSTLSGKYTNPNGTEYLEFKSKNKVVLHSGEEIISGKYDTALNFIYITFDTETHYSDAVFGINNNKDIIYHESGATFVKEDSMPWWGWALIIFFGLGIISVIYKAITKRDLGDDLEALGDKVDEFIDKDE